MIFASFKMVSLCIDTPLPMFLMVIEAALEGTFWNAVRLLCHGCLNDLIASIAMAFHCSFKSRE
jgi:hypothetical protein